LELYKHRTEFDLYRCPNIDCHGREVIGKRYKWRHYLWEPEDLQVSKPQKPVVDLHRVRFGGQVLAQAVHSVVGLGLSLRQAQQNLWASWQCRVSHEAIRQWILTLAYQVAPLLEKLPLPLSGTVAVDETYVRVRGRWHYLFTAVDGQHGHVLAMHLSPTRSALAATTILRAVARRYGNRPWKLVTDGASIYPIAVQYLQATNLANISQHQVVLGLEKTPDDPPGARRFKNRVERLFGSYKAHYKRHKSFQSYHGAVAHAILYMAFYNHLKPHDSHQGQPPVPLTTASGQPVQHWEQLLQVLARPTA
jgi:transposase-like protein